MRLVLGALVLATLAADAYASSCGGGGDSSSSSSGSSGGGSSESATPACTDASDVVGYRTCTGYGAWAANMKIPLLIFEWGMGLQRFESPMGERTGSVTHEDESFTYRVSSGGSANHGSDSATAVVTTARVGMGSRLGFYGALEFELGGLVAEPTRVEMTQSGTRGTPTIEQGGTLAMGALGVVGFQRGTQHLLLGAEILGGVRAVSYSYDSQYLACETTDSIIVGRGVVEARARASVFVTPMVSVGAQLGTSLVDERAWSAGVYVGGYTRAFATSR